MEEVQYNKEEKELAYDRLNADNTAKETARAEGEATNGAQTLPPDDV